MDLHGLLYCARIFTEWVPCHVPQYYHIFMLWLPYWSVVRFMSSCLTYTSTFMSCHLNYITKLMYIWSRTFDSLPLALFSVSRWWHLHKLTQWFYRETQTILDNLFPPSTPSLIIFSLILLVWWPSVSKSCQFSPLLWKCCLESVYFFPLVLATIISHLGKATASQSATCFLLSTQRRREPHKCLLNECEAGKTMA